jgi:transaldolase
MSTPIESLVATGTKLWLDSIDPDLVKVNRGWGATGATSNPIIVGDLLMTGRFDKDLIKFMDQGLDDEATAWAATDLLVRNAQEVFLPLWEKTRGNDGYVSFELDPLLEDEATIKAKKWTVKDRSQKYIELGLKWAEGHKNRMIKVPNTEAGLGALEELCANGITLNVTLTFTQRQYFAARDVVWKGAQRRKDPKTLKSVYSIFVSRVDQYTEKHCKELNKETQGWVGIVNAKQIWKLNKDFWKDKNLPLENELIFASTGTKNKTDDPVKYVEAFAGSDIETNPPATNDALQASGRTIQKNIDKLPSQAILDDIAKHVKPQHLEDTLMSEGTAKFAEPHKKLLGVIAEKRKQLGKKGA